MKKSARGFINAVKSIDKLLLFLTIGLFSFGLLCIATASSRQSVDNYNLSVYYFAIKQGKNLLIGLVIYIFLLFVPTKNYNHKTMIFGWLAAILGLNFLLLQQGGSDKGALNWITLPIVGNFQPSEVIKIVIIVSLACLFEGLHGFFKRKNKNHALAIVIVCLTAFVEMLFLIFEKDFGTMIILMFIFLVMFFASNIPIKEKLMTMAVCFVCGIVGIFGLELIGKSIFTEEIKTRFDFINPCSVEKRSGDGYQMCNGYIAMNLGGVKGVGLGKSTQKYSYIPEPHTDMIFSIIIEEGGYLTGLALFIAYIVLILDIMALACKAVTIKGRFICLGVATYIMAHIFVNLAVLFGIFPTTGVPLPFISYGGTFTIALAVALAIVQRINIETRLSIMNK